jgi:hypothetical protein
MEQAYLLLLYDLHAYLMGCSYDSVKHILAEMAQRMSGGQFILLTKHDHRDWEVYVSITELIY